MESAESDGGYLEETNCAKWRLTLIFLPQPVQKRRMIFLLYIGWRRHKVYGHDTIAILWV